LILTPQAMTDPTGTAEQVVRVWQQSGCQRPILASWMGGAEVDGGEHILNQAGIPTYRYPDQAARVFSQLWCYSYTLRGLYETPTLTMPEQVQRQQVVDILSQVRSQGRLLLTEAESKAVLAAYGIPVVPTRVASSVEEAVAAAEAMGYPVVLKLHSYTITHKTEVGGVQLNLGDGEAVRRAYQTMAAQVGSQDFQGVTVQPMIPQEGYELIVGSSQDPQFGPVLVFGSGGQLVEIFQDRAIGLPPLNSTLARRLMEQTLIYKALQGVRGRPPVDLEALAQLLVRFSQLVAEQPGIREMDINPLLASPRGLMALDARIVLQTDPPVPLAIRPYPLQYIWHLADGLTIRPIRPEDEPLLVNFHRLLSEQSVYGRYLQHLTFSARTAHERLTRICFVDYDREIALVAQLGDAEIAGVARLERHHQDPGQARFGVLVADPYQRRGIGRALLTHLLQVARQEGITHLVGEILPENLPMQKLCRQAGMQLQATPTLIYAHWQA
ncbi:MAG: GNAT family N-acetyltransferase, partial [Thermostichales cyanobacterium BF4_bins_65]